LAGFAPNQGFENQEKGLLMAVSLSDIITSWIANTAKLWKPFSRSLSELISLGEMSKPCLSLWVLKSPKAVAHEFGWRLKMFELCFTVPIRAKKPTKAQSNLFGGFLKRQE